MKSREIKDLKGLNYNIGDVVYLKSDTKFTTPMTIIDYSMSEEADYITRWLNIQKSIQQNGFPEDALTIKPVDYKSDKAEKNKSETGSVINGFRS